LFEHLTEKQIENFSRQKLSTADLLAFSDHLGECQVCRSEVEKALDGEAAFFKLRAEMFGGEAELFSDAPLSTHPSFEQIAEYVDETAAGEEQQIVRDHLVSCDQCALAVNDLQAFREQVAPGLNRNYQPESVRPSEGWVHRLLSFLPGTWSRLPLALGSAFAVLLLAVTGWLVLEAIRKRDMTPEIVKALPSPTLTPLATLSVSPTILPTPQPEVIAELNDGPGNLTLDRDGNLSGADYLPAGYQRMVKDSLTKQRLERSSLLAGLTRQGSSLMGNDDQGNRFSVTEPVGKVVRSDRPTFRWSPLGGGKNYVVEVYDEKFNLMASSPPLSDNSWTPPQALKRNGIYSWQVKAIKDGQEVISPRPPAPQAKFRILDQAKANELAQARRAYAESHLTLGLLYVQAGLLDEAEQEFRALQKSNPDSALVRKLISQVQAFRR